MSGFDPADHFARDRLEKLSNLEEPYPPDVERDMTLQEYIKEFDSLEGSNELAGRVVEVRDHGGIRFVDLRDGSMHEEYDTVQVMMSRGEVGTDTYKEFENIDRGDFISVEGYPERSNTGEMSVMAEDWNVAAKALNHPPTDGLSEEERIRNRAVALREDSELHQKLSTRFEMTEKIREFLTDEGYLEVETPILQNQYGGANATPFETHAEAKDQEMYLRIAPELYLKRMLGGEFEKIFEIGKDFRNEDIDTTHNPEFTMLELYEAYADYEDMMDLTENLITHVVEEVHGEPEIPYGEEVLDFSGGWERMSMEESLAEFAEIEVSGMTDEEIREAAEKRGSEFPGGYTRGLGIMELFEDEVEQDLIDPTFIIDHPEETTPLCKDHREKDGRIERFELFAAGSEIANSYTELNDPVRQGEHFEDQAERFEDGDEEAHRMDMGYLEAIGHGMPPAGGLGIGIDRLAMLVTDSQSIKEVIPFPMISKEE